MHVCACVSQQDNDNEHLYWYFSACFKKKKEEKTTGKRYSVPAHVGRNARHQQNILVSVPHISACSTSAAICGLYATLKNIILK